MAFYIRLSLVSLLVLWAPYIRADWMNLTGAETSENIVEIYILDDHVKVKLEVYVGDLRKFEELVPDEWLKDTVGGSGNKRPSLEQRMHSFATKRLQFVTDKGVKLPAKLELLEARQRVDRVSAYAGMINPTTRQRVRQAPADKRVLYAEIVYPFAGKPESLQIIPPLNERGMVTANIGFVAYHQAVPITDFRFLGQPAKLNLNWQDPWYTKFENKNLTRHHKYPLMLYLYVEPRQVRLESLLRISDITELTGFNVEDSQLSAEDKRQQLQEHIKKYYADNGSLQIDGDLLKPDSIRVEFLTVSLKGLKVIENASSVDQSSLLVGISQKYFIEALPQKIESSWQFFNQRIDRIPVTVTDPVGPLMHLIDKDDPEFFWQNFLKKYSDAVMTPVEVDTGWNINIPYVGKTKIVNQMPDQAQAPNIVGGVLNNIRVAFIEKEPSKFSGALGNVFSEAVTTDEFDSLQKELAKLFSPRVTGGALGAVQVFNDIEIVNVSELNNAAGFRTTISGSANISAQHWGHIDKRQVKFQLLLDLIEEDKQWRLADLTVIDIKEVK